MIDYKVGDRVMIMLGPDHPSRGTVLAVKGTKVQVDLNILWPPRTEVKWYEWIELLKLEEEEND